MQITASRISPVMMEFQIEVPAATVKAEVDKAYTRLGKDARIKGFRPGKTPRDVLRRLFGPQVTNDVAASLMQETLPRALQEKNVIAVSQPVVEPGALDGAAAFQYKARFEVQPDLDEVVYEGFTLYRPEVEVDEKRVEEKLEELRVHHATLAAPDPARPSQAKDVLTIDFTVSIDGQEIADAGGQGVPVELGVGQALAELDAALHGRNVGDEVTCEVPFPDAHPRESFRGKTGVFKVSVTDMKARVLADLDDDFAKDVGNFQTLIELRADVHTKLEKMAKDRAETAVAEQLVTHLNEKNPCEVPPSLVEAQARMMEQEIDTQARRVGQRFTKEQVDVIRAQIRVDAERKVRAGLLMAAIAKKHEFKVTDVDIETGMKELAEETGKNIAKLRVEYREKAKRDILIGMILEDKILDFLESKSTIVEGDPPAAPEAKDEGAARAGAQGEQGEQPKKDEEK